MPYFERKPWAESVGKVDVPEVLTEHMAPPAVDEAGIVDIAQEVLSAETGPQHPLDGPYRCREVLRPGGEGRMVLEVAADRNGGPLTLDLSPSDLRSGQHVLPSNRVAVTPSHLSIPPGGAARFEVAFTIPMGAVPGLYSGRIIGTGPEPVSFLIEVEVDKAG